MEFFKYKKVEDKEGYEVVFIHNEQFKVVVQNEEQAIALVEVLTKAFLAGMMHSSKLIEYSTNTIFNNLFKVTEEPTEKETKDAKGKEASTKEVAPVVNEENPKEVDHPPVA